MCIRDSLLGVRHRPRGDLPFLVEVPEAHDTRRIPDGQPVASMGHGTGLPERRLDEGAFRTLHAEDARTLDPVEGSGGPVSAERLVIAVGGEALLARALVQDA